MSNYKIYFKTNHDLKKVGLSELRSKKILNELISGLDPENNVTHKNLKEANDLFNAIIESDEQKKALNKEGISDFGLFEKDYSNVDVIYIVDTNNYNNSFVYASFGFTFDAPLSEEFVKNELIEFSDFIKKAVIVKRNAEITYKDSGIKKNVIVLCKLDDLILTLEDDVICLYPLDSKRINIQYKDFVDYPCDYDFIYNLLKEQIKISGFDIDGEKII